MTLKSAKELFFNSNRFDLLFKYLYVKYKWLEPNNHSFFKNIYLKHIDVFNGFSEDDKHTAEDFVDAFEQTYQDILENGFDATKSIIPVNESLNPVNGAHRLAICAYLNKDVAIEHTKGRADYDYQYFARKGLDPDLMDYIALQCTKNNPKTFVLNIHSVAEQKLDAQAEHIINKYAQIFYKKNVELTENGYVHLKIVSYKHDTWSGGYHNKFKGARKHALNSTGKNPLRAYVLIADSVEQMVQLKAELRDLYQQDNFSVHITDTQDQAVDLAEILFNDNSLKYYNKVDYFYYNKRIEEQINLLDEYVTNNKIDKEDILIIGSYPLGILNLRQINDLDFISSKELSATHMDNVNADNGGEHDLHKNKNELIYNPHSYFYYKNYKVIALHELKIFKQCRNEAKDRVDIKLIDSFDTSNYWGKFKGILYRFLMTKILKPKHLKLILKPISQLLPVKSWRVWVRSFYKKYM